MSTVCVKKSVVLSLGATCSCVGVVSVSSVMLRHRSGCDVSVLGARTGRVSG
jgi:hypothetical protein